MKVLKERFNLDSIIVTKGCYGEILNVGIDYFRSGKHSANNDEIYERDDAFLAAFISKLAEGVSHEKILDVANASGATIASSGIFREQ